MLLAAASIPLAQAVDETMTLSMAVAIPDLATGPHVLIECVHTARAAPATMNPVLYLAFAAIGPWSPPG